MSPRAVVCRPGLCGMSVLAGTMLRLFILVIALLACLPASFADEAWQDIKDAHPPVVGTWHEWPPDLRAVAALGDGRTLVAVGDNGTVLRSDDGKAEQWTVVHEKAGANLHGVAALGDGRTLVAVGANGTVLRSNDGKAAEWRVVREGRWRRPVRDRRPG